MLNLAAGRLMHCVPLTAEVGYSRIPGISLCACVQALTSALQAAQEMVQKGTSFVETMFNWISTVHSNLDSTMSYLKIANFAVIGVTSVYVLGKLKDFF